MAQVQYEMGRLFCGKMRDYLNECKFSGHDIEFIEGTGWASRCFTIKGNNQSILMIGRDLKAFSDRMEALERSDTKPAPAPKKGGAHLKVGEIIVLVAVTALIVWACNQ